MTIAIVQPLSSSELEKAFEGSYYFIAGAGGDLAEWVTGYEDLMEVAGIGKPLQWFQTTGLAVNVFADVDEPRPGDLFLEDLTCLLFPLDGLEIGKLAMFKLNMQDRWFDDVINNMRRRI